MKISNYNVYHKFELSIKVCDVCARNYRSGMSIDVFRSRIIRFAFAAKYLRPFNSVFRLFSTCLSKFRLYVSVTIRYFAYFDWVNMNSIDLAGSIFILQILYVYDRKILYKIGPSTDSCSTPEYVLNVSDFSSLMWTIKIFCF